MFFVFNEQEQRVAIFVRAILGCFFVAKLKSFAGYVLKHPRKNILEHPVTSYDILEHPGKMIFSAIKHRAVLSKQC